MTDWPKNPDFEPHPVATETPPPVVVVVDPQATTRTLSTIASPPDAGMTSGGGVYPIGATVTVQATPNVDKHFVQWTYINGLVASMYPIYTFSLTSDTDLVANFAAGAAVPELQGPLNVFVERMGAADALNRAYDVKSTYNQIGFEQGEGEAPPPVPDGTPISAGGPITIDETKYMIEPQFVGQKVIPRRR